MPGWNAAPSVNTGALFAFRLFVCNVYAEGREDGVRQSSPWCECLLTSKIVTRGITPKVLANRGQRDYTEGVGSFQPGRITPKVLANSSPGVVATLGFKFLR
jgi:hypothetical protein